MKAHVADYKKDTVQEFVQLIKEHPIIGAINMENMPAPQLQVMRKMLRGKATIRMTKRRLLKIAIEQCKQDKQGIEQIEAHLGGMPAVLFTKENPFTIYKTLQKNKSKAPAKGGQAAPFDIIVPAGPTPFAPGPVISELGGVGIKAGVEAGKVAIKQDSTVAKQGQIISDKLAGILTRLGIEPMEVGLDLVAVYESGVIFTKSVLHIDEVQFMGNVVLAFREALNLSVEAGYATKDNAEVLIGKCFTESKGLAMEINFFADAVAEELVIRAEREILALKYAANIAIPDKKLPQDSGKDTATAHDNSSPSVEDSAANESEEALKQKMNEDAKIVSEQLKEDIDKAEHAIDNASPQEKAEMKQELETFKEVMADGIREEYDAEQEEMKVVEGIVDKLKKNYQNEQEKKDKQEKNKESEKLFAELKKKGTLRKT